MTKSERRTIYEAGVIAASGMGMAFAVPTLISAHDSIALLAALLLGFGWLIWTAYFLYRVNTKG